jgi:hypothetical protein
VHRLRLAGQQRLVGLQAVAGAHHAVGHQLVAGPQADQVACDQFGDSDVCLRGVADDANPRRAKHGEPVEGDLGAQFLSDADQRVGDQDNAEQGGGVRQQPGSPPAARPGSN